MPAQAGIQGAHARAPRQRLLDPRFRGDDVRWFSSAGLRDGLPEMTAMPFDDGGVTGFLHEPDGAPAAHMVLTHGAGSDCRAPLLVAVAEGFAAAGLLVL